SSMSGQKKINLNTMSSYATSQIVRYVPGKIWGIVYQSAQMAGSIPARIITAGNLLQFLYTSIFSTLIISCIASWYFDFKLLSLVILSSSLWLMWFLHKKEHINTYILKKLTQLTKSNKPLKQPIRTDFGTLLLSLAWIFYILIWIVLLPDGISNPNFIYLAALYAAASLIAIAAAFSPGGIAIREASFFLLGAALGYDAELLLAYGLILRIILTLSEIIFATSFLIIKRYQHV
ncbi:MAG: lysylphosphatidylglycerol synthase domain-containing protein, partial [Mariprofundaceae bacterium]